MVDQRDVRRARRVVILSRSNGLSAATMALIALAAAIALGDPYAGVAALGLCTGAALEIAGSFQASRRSPAAPRTLVGSQLVGLCSLIAFLTRCIVTFPAEYALVWMPASLRELLLMLYTGPGEAEWIALRSIRITLAGLAVVAALYEGGLAFFYARSGATLQRLAESDRGRPQ